jgi:hypothetical protein
MLDRDTGRPLLGDMHRQEMHLITYAVTGTSPQPSFRAVCTCGWHGLCCWRQTTAVDDGIRHQLAQP